MPNDPALLPIDTVYQITKNPSKAIKAEIGLKIETIFSNGVQMPTFAGTFCRYQSKRAIPHDWCQTYECLKSDPLKTASNLPKSNENRRRTHNFTTNNGWGNQITRTYSKKEAKLADNTSQVANNQSRVAWCWAAQAQTLSRIFIKSSQLAYWLSKNSNGRSPQGQLSEVGRHITRNFVSETCNRRYLQYLACPCDSNKQK